MEDRTVLEAFDRTLAQETHNLARWPELTRQQLYNRPRWEEEPVPWLVEPGLDRRSAPGGAPWSRTRTRFRESEALCLTLVGHSSPARAYAISLDSDFVVSASDDRTRKIWDAATIPTQSVWLPRVASTAPLAASQTLGVLSYEPETMRVPSGEWVSE